MNAEGVIGRLPIKCEDSVGIPSRGRIGDLKVWRVIAVAARGKPPAKYKDRVLRHLNRRVRGMNSECLCKRGRPLLRCEDRVYR